MDASNLEEWEQRLSHARPGEAFTMKIDPEAELLDAVVAQQQHSAAAMAPQLSGDAVMQIAGKNDAATTAVATEAQVSTDMVQGQAEVEVPGSNGRSRSGAAIPAATARGCQSPTVPQAVLPSSEATPRAATAAHAHEVVNPEDGVKKHPAGRSGSTAAQEHDDAALAAALEGEDGCGGEVGRVHGGMGVHRVRMPPQSIW